MGAYDRDFHAWTVEQAALIRSRSANALDWENLAEEVEGLGRQQRAEVRSRLIVLVLHLLKYAHQPDRRSRSWRSTIIEQRDQIRRELEESPSLVSHQALLFSEAYDTARRRAAAETGLDVGAFPSTPAFDLEQAMDQGWLPEPDSDLA